MKLHPCACGVLRLAGADQCPSCPGTLRPYVLSVRRGRVSFDDPRAPARDGFARGAVASAFVVLSLLSIAELASSRRTPIEPATVVEQAPEPVRAVVEPPAVPKAKRRAVRR